MENTNIVGESTFMPEEVFNEPWMDNLDPHLLFRYWKKKGCPKILLQRICGVTLVTKTVGDMGIFSYVHTPKFTINPFENLTK